MVKFLVGAALGFLSGLGVGGGSLLLLWLTLVVGEPQETARVMRKELRSRGVNHHTVLFSPEEPLTPIALEAPPPGRRSIPASVSWVPSVAGLMIAGRIILDIVGNNG